MLKPKNANKIANLNSKIVMTSIINLASKMYIERTHTRPFSSRPDIISSLYPKRYHNMLTSPMLDVPTRSYLIPLHEWHKKAWRRINSQKING